ncbi:MAG: hypothetical protein SF162_20185 [bacterium]|nr:hypothetical protein [bacterium]
MSSNPQPQSRNIVPALVLIAIGVIVLIAQFGGGIGWLFGAAWPLLVAMPGLIFLAIAHSGDRNAAGFYFPGTIITGIGAMLAYQNFADHWESWAYAWALIPVFVGLALILSGRRQDNEGAVRTGRGMVTGFGAAFIGMAAFFELLIFDNLSFGLAPILLPALIILGGVYLLLNGRGAQAESAPPEKLKRAPVSLADLPTKRKVEPLPTEEERLINLHGENKRVPAGDNLRRQIDRALKDDPQGG